MVRLESRDYKISLCREKRGSLVCCELIAHEDVDVHSSPVTGSVLFFLVFNDVNNTNTNNNTISVASHFG